MIHERKISVKICVFLSTFIFPLTFQFNVINFICRYFSNHAEDHIGFSNDARNESHCPESSGSRHSVQ